MAQDPFSIIKETQPQIENLQGEIKKYQEKLSSSPTASSSNTEPTFRDLTNEARASALQTQLRSLQKKNLTAAWYGSETGESGVAEHGGVPGIIGTALNVLQRPLQGVVKGVKALTGDTSPTPEGQEFTDLLAQRGVRGPLGSVLGFTADVMLDPVNWLTAGTAALIPRVGYGLYRGAATKGLEGAARAGTLGLSSSLGQKASFLARHTPLVPKSFAESLSQKSAQAYENYKVLTGVDPLKYVTSGGIGRGTTLGAMAPGVGTGMTIGDLTKGLLSYISGGSSFYKSLYYSSRDWLETQKLMDVIYRASAKTVEEARPVSALGAKLSEGESLAKVKPNVDVLKNVPPGREKDALIDELNKIASDVDAMISNPKGVSSVNPEQNTFRILQEASRTDELRVALQGAYGDLGSAVGPTGVKWYDDAVAWGNKFKMKIGKSETAPIRVFIDTYNSIIQGAFKPAHTILSPVTWAMNTMSALPMYMMMGGENAAGFVKDYMKAYAAYAGVDPRNMLVRALLGEATKADEAWKTARAANVRQFMEQYPETTRRSITRSSFFLGHHSIQKMVDDAVSSGLYTKTDAASGVAERELLAAHEELRNQIRAGDLSGKPKQSLVSRAAAFLGKKVYSPAETQSDIVKALKEQALEGEIQRGALGGERVGGAASPRAAAMGTYDTVAGQTIRDQGVPTDLLDRVDKFIKAKADAGSRPFSVFQNLMDTARAGYEHQDQAFRTAVITQLMNHGITEDGLKIMSRTVPVTNRETQILSEYVLGGKKMYRMSMDYALEVAHEAAINYGAMPAAIRMLRSMPLVGAPFASFSYGMGLRTAQTLAYNPSIFNKISFGMESFQGRKTPIEKESLKSKYYKWYNQPSMFRVPDAVNFFSEHPLYWNLSNMLPYYSLNIFQPPNRTYKDVLPNTIVQLLDRSPVMKDPLGQMLFDNFLLPTLLSNTDRPTSMVGAPLYPINATAADKAFYAGRGLVDAFTPAVVAPAGLVLPPDYAKYYPGYRTRQMSYGKAEKSAIGIPGQETAASRAIRNILAYFGIPIQIANTSYAKSQLKSEMGE